MQVGLLGLLGLLFVGLKLSNIIAWSWWLVLMPFYAFPALALAIFLIVFAGSLVGGLCKLVYGAFKSALRPKKVTQAKAKKKNA